MLRKGVVSSNPFHPRPCGCEWKGEARRQQNLLRKRVMSKYFGRDCGKYLLVLETFASDSH